MRTTANYENSERRNESADEKARRNIMWMQMFNYDRTNRDSFQRPIEMSAAVAAGSERKSGVKKKSIAIVMLIILTFSAVLLLRHPVSGMVNKFFLGHQLVRMVLKEPEAVGFDMDAIQTSSNGRLTRDGYYHWESYDTWADIPFENVIKDFAKENDSFSFSNFGIGSYEENNVGVVTTYVTGKENNVSYQLKGHFKIAGYTPEHITLVNVGNKANFSYKSECAIKAYFVRDESAANYHVYFMMDGILFEMKAAANEKNVETVKQILDMIK